MICIHNKYLFYSPKYEVFYKEKIKKHKKEMKIIKDTLFFIIYMKVTNEILSMNYFNESLEKTKMIELLQNESFKFKYKNKVIDNLSENKINLFTFYHKTRFC